MRPLSFKKTVISDGILSCRFNNVWILFTVIRLIPLKLTPSRIAVSAALLSLIIISSDVWSISTSIVPTITALPFFGFKSPIAESLNASFLHFFTPPELIIFVDLHPANALSIMQVAPFKSTDSSLPAIKVLTTYQPLLLKLTPALYESIIKTLFVPLLILQ